jgi:sterol desaturase/sphingolipid hydroxylase (fatty acid hydroxylase superfamily)
VNERLVAYAIPFFFLLIGVEVVVARAMRLRLYRFSDSIADLSCGVGQQQLLPFFKAIHVAAYLWLFEHARLYTVSATSIVGWVVLLFGVDLAYYAFHRASHRINFFWAAHVVHHQSEEYNLSVALRQSWFDEAISWVFYLPLAICGFPAEMFLLMSTCNTLYQFWIHTRAVKRLGPLEWFMNTPSHHRVHHGTNPKYIDKNYAGVFIIWDRLFGTFQAEEEEPVYGIVKPLASYNPFWANVHYWAEMAKLARACPKLWQKLWVVLAPPEWRPREMGGNVTIPEVSRETQKKYDPRAPLAVTLYVGVQFLMVGALTGVMGLNQAISFAQIATVTGLVLVNVLAWSALLEARRWAVGLELARLAVVPLAALWIAGTTAAVVAGVTSVLFAAWAVRYRGTPASAASAETVTT